MTSKSHIKNTQFTSNLIIVMGVSGCGKSTIAHALAEKYVYMYLDADDFHSQESRELMQQGIPLTDELRLPWVHRIRDFIDSHAALGKHFVLAFSGLKKKHRDILRTCKCKAIFLHLQSDAQTIQKRVTERNHHYMPASLVDSQFASLEMPDKDEGIFSINANHAIVDILYETIYIIDETMSSTDN